MLGRLASYFLFLLFLSMLLLSAKPSYAKTFRIFTEEFPPYNYTVDGKLTGISTEIVREILNRVGHPDRIKVTAWSPAYKIIQEESGVILFSTTRTSLREDLFKWVGPLVPNNTVFYAKKGRGITINSLDDAKKVGKIGVYKDDYGELLLKSKGFNNTSALIGNKENLERLMDGEIDLWVANELTGAHFAKDMNLSSQIEKVFDVQKDYMYIAFSKSTPDDVIKKWQDALDQMQSDGTYVQILSQWVAFSYKQTSHVTAKELIIYLSIFLGILFVFAIIVWNRQLKGKVDSRTAELKIAKEKAEDANKAKSQFLSSMSHELRTPLNSIIGFTQLLESDKDDPLSVSQQENLGLVKKSGEHLLQLINEVIDLSRIESGNISISVEAVNLFLVIQEATDSVEGLAYKRRIEITTNREESYGVYVKADRVRLRQVFLNLLSNAIKYNRRDGKVTIRMKKADKGMFKITIEDTGEGISEEKISGLFEPFNRLGAETLNIEGTGIGLTITKSLIELMGGRIEAKSEIGVGTSFSIYIPLTDKPSDLPEESKVKSVEINHNNDKDRKLLYVEDNPANLMLVGKIMERRKNVKMIIATEAEKGIELAKSELPDLILMDINLPGINGYEALDILKTSEATKNIPVIAMSANAMEDDLKRGRQAGFVDYITKPINVNKFLETVDKFLCKS